MDIPRQRPTTAKANPPRRRGAFELVMGSGLGKLLSRFGVAPRPTSSEGLLDLAGALLSLRGRASGPALASAFFDLYEGSDIAARQAFLAKLHANYPHNAEAQAALGAWHIGVIAKLGRFVGRVGHWGGRRQAPRPMTHATPAAHTPNSASANRRERGVSMAAGTWAGSSLSPVSIGRTRLCRCFSR